MPSSDVEMVDSSHSDGESEDLQHVRITTDVSTTT